MRLAKRLVSGVDIWLNTPTRPLEASGTSGEKAQMNGVLNFSVLDGWWYEGFRENAGWALTDKRTYDNQQFQDQLDAATIYSMLENEVIPLYYAKNSKGYSPEWVQYIKNSIAQIAPHYTTKRMFDDYTNRFYTTLATRSAAIKADSYAKAKELAAWKEQVAQTWDSVEIVSIAQQEKNFPVIEVGSTIPVDVVIDKHGLKADIGLELVKLFIDPATNKEVINVYPINQVKTEGTRVYFKSQIKASQAGNFKFGLRLYPSNIDLPHRMDFAYVKWITI
jgi:starch phosphorylase